VSAPETLHSAIVAPQGVWWKPAHKAEKTWVAIAFAWCMVLSAMMPIWHFKGSQNPSGIRGRTEPAAFMARVQAFTDQYKVGEDHGLAVVEPPPGADVYMIGMMWQWMPVLRLHEGVAYTLHLSSLDVLHGFSLYPVNVNFEIVPGYDYGLRIVPNRAGDYRVICNEFCGIGHHTMVGRVLVLPKDTPALPYLRDSAATAAAAVPAAAAPKGGAR
jgi:cytochrome c oxidase subunit 2